MKTNEDDDGCSMLIAMIIVAICVGHIYGDVYGWLTLGVISLLLQLMRRLRNW